VTEEWRKLHNEELHDLYSSPSITRIIKARRTRWAGHVARMAEKRNAYRLLVGKPEGRRPLGRPRHRWLDNIRMDLVEVGWGQCMKTCFNASLSSQTSNDYRLHSRRKIVNIICTTHQLQHPWEPLPYFTVKWV
jgi:hypothetical protein